MSFPSRHCAAERASVRILRRTKGTISRNDFLAKIYIALKEAYETLYWLGLLYEAEYLTEEEFASLKADCEELKKMLSATMKTMPAPGKQP